MRSAQPEITGPTAEAPTVETIEPAASLADLLRVMNDESQDPYIRIEAAKAALVAQGREMLTINIVKYGDADNPAPDRQGDSQSASSPSISHRTPLKSRFYFDCFWRAVEVSSAAVECADQVMAKIKQEAHDKAELERLVQNMRAGGVALEEILDELDTI